MADWSGKTSPRSILLTVDGASSTLTTAGKTLMKSLTLKGRTLGNNGMLIIDIFLVSANTSGTHTLFLTFGGTDVITYAPSSASAGWLRIYMANRNSAKSQYIRMTSRDKMKDELGTIGTMLLSPVEKGAANTATIDTTLDQTLAVNGTLGAVGLGNSLIVRAWCVQVVNV